MIAGALPELLETLPIGIVVLDRAYRVVRWNQWLVMRSGISADSIIGRNLIGAVPGINTRSLLRACRAAFAFGNVIYLSQRLHRFIFPFELQHGDVDGITQMQQSCTVSPVRVDETIRYVCVTVEDVTDSVLLEEKLRHLNIHDTLTGAYNRRYLERRIGQEINRHARYERSLSIVLMDLDHFKAVNDAHGHLAGDEILRAACATVSGLLRESDLIVRWGGEEFLCLLPETNLTDAVGIAERMREAISARPVELVGSPAALSASFGVATLCGHDDDEGSSLFSRADRALYEAKRQGRNRVVAQAEPDR